MKMEIGKQLSDLLFMLGYLLFLTVGLILIYLDSKRR